MRKGEAFDAKNFRTIQFTKKGAGNIPPFGLALRREGG